MKTKHKYLNGFYIMFLLLLVSLSGCKEPEQYGYLSDNLRYVNNPWTVAQGSAITSSGLTQDNSTPPLNVTLVEIRDAKTGQRAEAFYKKYPSYIWKDAYNPATDTTLALINAKRELGEAYPLEVLPVTGQVMLSSVTGYVPQGDYILDIDVENSAGKKYYPNMMTLKLREAQTDIPSTPYFMVLQPGSESTYALPFYDNTTGWIDKGAGETGSLSFTVTRKSVTEDQLTYQDYSRVILKVLDKYGKAFPGKAIEARASNLRTLKDYAQKTTVQDSSIMYEFGVLPFPAPYWDGQSNNTLNYYRIYSDQYIASIDTINPKTWDPPRLPQYSRWDKPFRGINIRFSFRVFEPGTYEAVIKLHATKKD